MQFYSISCVESTIIASHAGILAGIWPCGIITILSELYVTESKSQVYGALHDFIQRCCSSLSDLSKFKATQLSKETHLDCQFQNLCLLKTGYICYDDGCHLRRFAQNPTRRDITPTAQRISSLNIVVDKMHMAGHVDKWCKENCDARKFTFLDNVSVHVITHASIPMFKCCMLKSWEDLVNTGVLTNKAARRVTSFFSYNWLIESLV